MKGKRPIIGDQEQLLVSLREAFGDAGRVKVIVSFLMESVLIISYISVKKHMGVVEK